MARLESFRRSASSGTGAPTALNWKNEQVVQTATFSSGLTISLSQTPHDSEGILLYYNGQKMRLGHDFSVSGTTITVLFGDVPADYDTGHVIFETTYTHA